MYVSFSVSISVCAAYSFRTFSMKATSFPMFMHKIAFDIAFQKWNPTVFDNFPAIFGLFVSFQSSSFCCVTSLIFWRVTPNISRTLPFRWWPLWQPCECLFFLTYASFVCFLFITLLCFTALLLNTNIIFTFSLWPTCSVCAVVFFNFCCCYFLFFILGKRNSCFQFYIQRFWGISSFQFRSVADQSCNP